MVFSLPVLQKRDAVTEIQFSDEEFQRQQDTIKNRDDISKREQNRLLRELKKEFEETRRKQEEENQRRKESEKQRIVELKELYGKNYRDSFFGKMLMVFQKRDDLLSNTLTSLKDSLGERIFGKSLEDKERDGRNDLQRTTIVERILTGEKYKDRPILNESFNDDYETPSIKRSKKLKSRNSSFFNLQDNSSSNNDGPLKVEDEKVKTPLEKMLEVLLSIKKSMEVIIKENYKKFLSEKKSKISSELLADETSDPKGLIENVKEKIFNLSPMIFGSVAGIFTAISSTILGFTSKLISLIAKAFPITALAAGLFMTIKDAFLAYDFASTWDVSKISAVIGGVLGGIDNGIRGALKNAGKWALIGAGVGSFIPVIGTLIGGLIGGAFGAILGFFGGEKIAKFFDKIGAFLYEQYEKFKNIFLSVADKIISIFTPLVDFIKSIPFKEMYDSIIKIFDGISNVIKDIITFISSISLKEIKDIFVNGIKSLFDRTKQFIKDLLTFDFSFMKSNKDDVILNQKDNAKIKEERIIETKDNKALKIIIERTPIDFKEKNAEIGKPLKDLVISFDKYAKNVTEIQSKQAIIKNENVYDQSLQNSNYDYRRSYDMSKQSTSTVVANSNNKIYNSIVTQPRVKDDETSIQFLSRRGGSGFFSNNRY